MSIEWLKQFITDGSYREMKILENEMRAIKDHVEKALNERGVVVQRIEWKDVGMVAKYSKVNIYEWDREGLSSLLDSLGVLPLVCSIDEKLLSQDQRIKLTPCISEVNKSIRYCPNSLGKVSAVVDLPQKDIKENLIRWKECNHKYKLLRQDCKRKKEAAVNSISLIGESSIEWEYGRFNVQESVDYSVLDVFETLGREFLINTSKVKTSAIDRFVARGIVKKADINAIRKVVDISVRFTLMEITSEERCRQYFRKLLHDFSKPI